MVAAIRRIVNDTPWVVHYYNTEDKQSFTVFPKERTENNDWLPAETCDSWIPYASSGHYIEVTLSNSGPLRISDDDYHWKFVDFPDGDTREGSESRVDGLERGGQYVLYFKKTDTNQGTWGALSILKYDSKTMDQAGYIASSVLQSAAVVVALVLMAMFL